jgi:DNA (cytosine-5)-methyltransferase 1
LAKNPNFKVVSLFSGCGGLDLGFHGGFEFLGQSYAINPFEVVYANDINAAATETYKLNFPSVGVVHNEDIRLAIDGASHIPNSADVVVGGFPCQDFSLAGKRQGLNVIRGQLYLSMVEVVRQTKPKIFLAENVKGLLTWEKGLALETITKDFKELGYVVSFKLLNAADYGVPETRERVIIAGVREDISTEYVFPEPTHSRDAVNGKKPWVSIRDAIGDLEDQDKHDMLPNSGYSKAKLLPGKQGNKVCDPNRPGPTMRAEHHGNIEFHYLGHRRLSAREAARIQSFPDSFLFYKSTTDAYRQIGNAVAPVFGWHLAQSLMKVLQN